LWYTKNKSAAKPYDKTMAKAVKVKYIFQMFRRYIVAVISKKKMLFKLFLWRMPAIYSG